MCTWWRAALPSSGSKKLSSLLGGVLGEEHHYLVVAVESSLLGGGFGEKQHYLVVVPRTSFCTRTSNVVQFKMASVCSTLSLSSFRNVACSKVMQSSWNHKLSTPSLACHTNWNIYIYIYIYTHTHISNSRNPCQAWSPASFLTSLWSDLW